MNREKRDIIWDAYEEACLEAENNYRKDVEPAYEKYLTAIHAAKADMMRAMASKNFHMPSDNRTILEPAWGKGLPCPYMIGTCRDDYCPCQTYSDWLVERRRRNDPR